MEQYINEICSQKPYKLVISNGKGQTEYKKITITQKNIRNKEAYQIEKFTEKQAFHENISPDALNKVLTEYMGEYKQLNAWTKEKEYAVKISKKGKVLFQRRDNKNPKLELAHNKTKNYLLKEGEIIPPLVDLGIFTKEGKVVHAMYDKYKQINRFIEMVEDVLKDYKGNTIHIIDFGCGKSYLTFILYYYMVEIKKMDAHILGLDLKKDVIETCNRTAEKYHYDNLRFQLGDINGYRTDMPVDMVITLHACDTATDYALYNAVSWNAKIILSVPCCQHELNQQMKPRIPSVLTRYGIIKERTAALMTDAIRGALLEYSGYKTQLLEFIDMEHSPKNILIRSVKGTVSKEKREAAMKEVKALCRDYGLQPTLLKLLEGEKDE